MNVRIFFMGAAIVMLLGGQSCVKVPLESLFPSTMTTNEENVKDFSDRIKEELKTTDIAGLAQGKAPNIPACEAAFGAFIDKTSEEGLIPFRKVTQKDYASTVATFCPDVNMIKEIRRAIQKEGEKDNDENTFIDLAKEAKSFTKHGCSGPILNPGRDKFVISFLKSVVQANTLNTHSVPMGIYYSTKTLTEEEINNGGAKKLIKDGTLRSFGITDVVAPKALGSQPITIIVTGEKYKEALKNILPLKNPLVAIPLYEKYEPYITMIGNEKYYVVPQGELVSKLAMDFVVEFSGKDAQCFLTETNQKYAE